jgi:hypothetical protein
MPILWYTVDSWPFPCQLDMHPPRGARFLGVSVVQTIEDDWLVIELLEAQREALEVEC